MIPIGSLRCLREAKTMDMILLLSVNLKLVSLYSVTYVVGTMRQFQRVLTTYVFSINKLFIISFLNTDYQLLSLFQ